MLQVVGAAAEALLPLLGLPPGRQQGRRLQGCRPTAAVAEAVAAGQAEPVRALPRPLAGWLVAEAAGVAALLPGSQTHGSLQVRAAAVAGARAAPLLLLLLLLQVAGLAWMAAVGAVLAPQAQPALLPRAALAVVASSSSF